MNRFEIIKDIDEGAFGFVQMARNKESGEIVAIKKIKKKYNSWDECMNLREIRSLKKLKNPNIIKLKEVFKLEQELYLVFEYARTNLFKLYSEEYKEKGKVMPEHLIKSMIFQAVSALAYIHKMGFFHRDMKPENVLITDRNILKIADFGLAREIRSSPPYTEYVSTRWYRSPEILLKNTNYNSPVDIWALGCIMAELYMNGPLFTGSSETDQLAKICAVLGYPGKVWPEGIRLASQTGFVFPNTQPLNLEEIIKNAPPLAIDMIKSMLNYESSKRPTALKLLQHPYFSQNNSSEIEMISPMSSVTPCLLQQQKEKQKPHNLTNLYNGIDLNSKNAFPNRNLLREMESNWHDDSFSNKKNNKYLQTPKSKQDNLTENKPTKFKLENDFEDFQFQKKLDSVFPEKQNKFKEKKHVEFDEEKLKLNITAKKKQIDVELEELEKQILATKKKYNSPALFKLKNELKEQNTEESAISKKRRVFYAHGSTKNELEKDKNTISTIFNDQLEELLTKEQKILDQKSIKNFEPKTFDSNFLKKNGIMSKNNALDNHVNISEEYFLSDISMLKKTNLIRNINSVLQLENQPLANFKINGFQANKVKTEGSAISNLIKKQF